MSISQLSRKGSPLPAHRVQLQRHKTREVPPARKTAALASRVCLIWIPRAASSPPGQLHDVTPGIPRRKWRRTHAQNMENMVHHCTSPTSFAVHRYGGRWWCGRDCPSTCHIVRPFPRTPPLGFVLGGSPCSVVDIQWWTMLCACVWRHFQLGILDVTLRFPLLFLLKCL